MIWHSAIRPMNSRQSTLIELLRGKGAHADPIACVSDLSFASATTCPPGHSLSIWEIVWHLNFWMNHEIRAIQGEPLAYPEHASLSWPSAQASPSEELWRESVARFRDSLARLIELAGSAPADLERALPPDKPGNPPSSVESRLWQTVAHNSYHIGQIVLLRRTMGLWPPPEGGDTW